jgi:hypothetical protein
MLPRIFAGQQRLEIRRLGISSRLGDLRPYRSSLTAGRGLIVLGLLCTLGSSLLNPVTAQTVGTPDQHGTPGDIGGRPQASGSTRNADHEWYYSIGGGLEHQFQSDTDKGGDFSVTRLNGTLSLKTDLAADLHLALRFSYGFDHYDFGGAPFGALGGGDPWQDIHTLGAGAILTYDFSTTWGFFGGPIVQFARESEADWGDSVIGGGVIGATYKLSDNLTVGGGVWAVTQIEDDPRVFPIIVLHWKLTDSLRLSNQTTANAAGRTGIELIWSVGRHWDLAIGVAKYFSRFRLDDDGVAPDGVGQDESLPVWFRASCDITDHIRIDALAGLNAFGELRLEDSSGHKIADTDYDAAPFVGVFATVRF